MPIQIRELIVTASIEELPTLNGTPNTNVQLEQNAKRERAELVQACVDEVMKAMKKGVRR